MWISITMADMFFDDYYLYVKVIEWNYGDEDEKEEEE